MSVVLERIEAVRDAIRDWVELSSDYDLIDDDQYSPEPDEPHFTFSVLSGLQRVGADSIVTKNGKFYKAGRRQLTATIRARGRPMGGRLDDLLRGTDMLAELDWARDKPDVYHAFASRDLALVRAEKIIETSTVEDNALIPRAAFEVVINLGMNEEIPLDYIDTVRISGDLDTTSDGAFDVEIEPFTITK